MKYFSLNEPYPEIPHSLFRCPICGASLRLEEINEYEIDTGKIIESGFHFGCVTEPDFDDPDYGLWFDAHYSMPYVDWLPLQKKIHEWLSAGFRLRLLTTCAPDVAERA